MGGSNRAVSDSRQDKLRHRVGYLAVSLMNCRSPSTQRRSASCALRTFGGTVAGVPDRLATRSGASGRYPTHCGRRLANAIGTLAISKQTFESSNRGCAVFAVGRKHPAEASLCRSRHRRVRLTRGFGTRAASRAMKSNGSKCSRQTTTIPDLRSHRLTRRRGGAQPAEGPANRSI
jgi:hypothetical protein